MRGSTVTGIAIMSVFAAVACMFLLTGAINLLNGAPWWETHFMLAGAFIVVGIVLGALVAVIIQGASALRESRRTPRRLSRAGNLPNRTSDASGRVVARRR